MWEYRQDGEIWGPLLVFPLSGNNLTTILEQKKGPLWELWFPDSRLWNAGGVQDQGVLWEVRLNQGSWFSNRVPGINLAIAPYTCGLGYRTPWPLSYHQHHLPKEWLKSCHHASGSRPTVLSLGSGPWNGPWPGSCPSAMQSWSPWRQVYRTWSDWRFWNGPVSGFQPLMDVIHEQSYLSGISLVPPETIQPPLVW